MSEETKQAIRKTIADSAGMRWGILLLVSFAMAVNYYFYDVLSPIQEEIIKKLGLSEAEYGGIIAAYSIPNAIFLMNVIDHLNARDAVARMRGKIQRFNPLPEYFNHLRTLIDFDAIAENPPRVVVDSMHGSGRGVIKGILQGTGCEVTEIRGEMNPGFGGTHPEPIGKNLGALAGAISTGVGDLGLALDGDADRIVMYYNGKYTPMSKFYAILAEHGLFKEHLLVDQRVSAQTVGFLEERGVRVSRGKIGRTNR